MKIICIAIATMLFSLPNQAKAAEDTESSRNSLGEMAVSLGFHSRMVTDSTWDLFSEEDWMPGMNLGLEYEVMEDLFVMAGYSYFNQKGWLYRSSTETQLELHEPLLGVRYGLSMLNAFRPYGVAAATLSFAEANLKAPGVPGQLDQDKILFGGRLGLGCEVFFPRTVFTTRRRGKKPSKLGRFSMGMAVEAGYYLRQPWSIDGLKPTDNGSDDDLDGLSMGNLDLTGGGELWTHGAYINVDFRFYF